MGQYSLGTVAGSTGTATRSLETVERKPGTEEEVLLSRHLVAKSWDSTEEVLGRYGLGTVVLGQCSLGTALGRCNLGTVRSWDSAVLAQWSWDSAVLGQWSWDSTVLGQWSWYSSLETVVMGQYSLGTVVLEQWS